MLIYDEASKLKGERAERLIYAVICLRVDSTRSVTNLNSICITLTETL